MISVMRLLLKKLVAKSVDNDALWRIVNKTLVRTARGFELQRRDILEKRHFSDEALKNALESILKDMTVKNGIFKGMRYPKLQAVGSGLYPKFIGSYEAELTDILLDICERSYDKIVDVGCAEGFYAVGLAMKIPSASVLAFDINEKALDLCRRMAVLNGVEERIEFGGICDSSVMMQIDFGRRGLIICDCEGFEKELFTDEVIPKLSSCDLLIETHDCDDIEISTYLCKQFANTHNLLAVSSIDDIQKAKYYEYPEIADCNLALRYYLLAERRRSVMEWLFLTPRIG